MIPLRQLDTGWGALYATCVRPGQVHCTTRVSSEVAETMLHIDGHAYRCEVALVRCASAHAAELGYQPIDHTWCADYRWGNLSPVDQMPRDSIGPAYAVLRFHVLPAVVAWLYTADAGALLHEGDTYWRAACERGAEQAERTLSSAWQKLQQVRRAVAEGQLISVEDEQFLRALDISTDPRRQAPRGGRR